MTAPWRIGIDVGGTFTDLALIDAQGQLKAFKTPSIPARPVEGIINVLSHASASSGLSLSALLGDTSILVHGSTVATNILLERQGARVGLICTAGFRDTLEIRRGIREDVWNHRKPYAPVLVPRFLRLPVRERLLPTGDTLVPVNEQDVVRAAQTFCDEGVESIAVCLLHAYAESRHERQVGEMLASAMGGSGAAQWISLSSAVVPVMGEFERCSTTVVNAYLAPRVAGYILQLERELRAAGLHGALYLQQSNGGVMTAPQAANFPVNLVLSGPAAGVGALAFYSNSVTENALIAMEIGGTSTDITMMRDMTVDTTDTVDIGGYPVAIPTVDIHTVAAGGGTIAGVDEAGMMYVGPRSAGAHPGPAGYGRGGSLPTVTDAHLMLGRLTPGAFTGGLTLDLDLSRRAIGRVIAEPAELTVEASAAGMLRLVNQQIRQAVEKVSIQRGLDAREFTLVACGGAGPLHGAEIARALGMRSMFVPRRSGIFCAFGMLNTDIRRDTLRSTLAPLESDALSRISRQFEDLQVDAEAGLAREGFSPQMQQIDRSLHIRYCGQQWHVAVSVTAAHTALDIRGAFEAAYERRFGHIQPGGALEICGLHLVARAILPRVNALHSACNLTSLSAPRSRPIHHDGIGMLSSAIHRGADLMPGMSIEGPAIIEELTTTILLGPGDVARVTDLGDYSIVIATKAAV